MQLRAARHLAHDEAILSRITLHAANGPSPAPAPLDIPLCAISAVCASLSPEQYARFHLSKCCGTKHSITPASSASNPAVWTMPGSIETTGRERGEGGGAGRGGGHKVGSKEADPILIIVLLPLLLSILLDVHGWSMFEPSSSPSNQFGWQPAASSSNNSRTSICERRSMSRVSVTSSNNSC